MEHAILESEDKTDESTETGKGEGKEKAKHCIRCPAVCISVVQ